MRLFRRRERWQHEVVVHDLSSLPPGDPSFVPICNCGWAGFAHATSDAAFAEARRHDRNVAAEIEQEHEEPGSSLCVFCGAPIEERRVVLTAHWSEGLDEREQWWASHRACLIERMSDDPVFRGPLHGDS